LEVFTLKHGKIHCSIIESETGKHLATPLSAWGRYDNKNQAHSKRVAEFPYIAENLLRVTSEKQHGTATDNAYNLSLNLKFAWL